MSALPWEDDLMPDAPEWLRSQPPAVPAAERERLFREQDANVRAGHVRNPYRDLPIHELLDEREYAGWSLVETQAAIADLSDADGESFAFTLWHDKAQLAMIESEIQRKRDLIRTTGQRPELRLHERQHIDFCRVKDSIPIADFMHRVYTPSGADREGKSRLVVRCFLPGHQDDETPSFTVYMAQNSFHCYGCGRGGDVVDLAKHWFNEENGAFAAKHLCEFMGVPVPRTRQYEPVAADTPHTIDRNGNIVAVNPELLRRRRTR